MAPRSPEASVAEAPESAGSKGSGPAPASTGAPKNEPKPIKAEQPKSAPEPARKIESVTQASKSVQVESGVTTAELGVPFYPGSTDFPRDDVKSAGPTGTTFTSVRMTQDSPLKVLDFYEKQLGAPLSANRQVAEPLEVWRADKALITVSTAVAGDQTKIIVTTSPSP